MTALVVYIIGFIVTFIAFPCYCIFSLEAGDEITLYDAFMLIFCCALWPFTWLAVIFELIARLKIKIPSPHNIVIWRKKQSHDKE